MKYVVKRKIPQILDYPYNYSDLIKLVNEDDVLTVNIYKTSAGQHRIKVERKHPSPIICYNKYDMYEAVQKAMEKGLEFTVEEWK